MQDQLQSLSKKVQENKRAHLNFFIKLRKKTPKNLDAIMEKLHDDELKKQTVFSAPTVAKRPVQFSPTKILRGFQKRSESKHVNL